MMKTLLMKYSKPIYIRLINFRMFGMSFLELLD